MDPNQNTTPTTEEQSQPVVITPQPADVVQPQTPPAPVAPTVNDVTAPTTPVADSAPATEPVPETATPVVDESTSEVIATNTQPTEPVADNNTSATMGDTLAAPVQSVVPKKRRPKAKLLVLIIIAVLVLLGASAGAYFGVILPNKPENKLMKAFMHMAGQTQVTTTGKVDYQSKGEGGNTVAVDYTFLTNTESKQFSLAGDVGVSGASVPFDARYIEDNMYMKLSGLQSIGALLGDVEGNETTQQLGTAFSSVNDKWFVIDRSLLQQSEESTCSLAVDWRLTEDDMSKIQQAYKNNPLFTIKSESTADISGVATTKFELDPASDDVAKNFAKELESISIVSNLKKCTEAASDQSLDSATDELAQNQEKGQLFAYVTEDNQMKKLEIIVEDDTYKLIFAAEFAFGQVNIEKPADAKPVQELLGLLMGGELLGQSTAESSATGAMDAGLLDAISL